jgi:hypothetical protein
MREAIERRIDEVSADPQLKNDWLKGQLRELRVHEHELRRLTVGGRL